ncbi:hypothetical protein [Kitasatospora sp. NPDC050463]|uniref:hypothetical protein n=1 Tax=Kitasatospora sp. NPDC050463 TaxID=3155786 RepID=UPI0033FE1BE0
MRRTARLAAALALAALAVGCTGQGAPAPAEPTGPRPYLADADLHGYLTYDPRTQALTGYTRDGARQWRRESIDPYEVHCVRTCPDAVVSLRPAASRPTPAGPADPAGGVLWILGGTATSDPAGDGTKIHWAASRDDWIGSTATALLLTNRGKRQETPLRNSASAVFRTSPDGTSAIVSTMTGETPEGTWSGQAVDIGGDGPALGRSIPGIPGPVGCWSNDGKHLVTLGKKPSVVTVADGSLRAGLTTEFASECSAGPSGIAVGEYRPSPSGNTGQASLFDGSSFRPVSTSKYLSNASGFKSTGPCVSFVQNGRLGFMNPGDGALKTTEILGVDTWPAGPAALYALHPDGRAELVPVTPENCPAAH